MFSSHFQMKDVLSCWRKWATKWLSFVWLPFDQMNHWPPLCCLRYVYLADERKCPTPVRDQLKKRLIARQPIVSRFIWSICGCYWGVSCCIPCGPLVGLPLQLPSLGSHPTEQRKKSWDELKIIQEISVIRECLWVETIVNPGPIPCKFRVCRLMMEAGSVGALNCLLFGWSLMPAGKTLCRSVVLSFCTFIRNFLCNRQILILIFIQHCYKKVSPQTDMMWMSMQHFFFF